MTFRLATLASGSNPIYWATVQELLGAADVPALPDASYRPFAEVVETMGGGSFGRGYPQAVWSFDALTAEQHYILRQICPGLSADVYIETLTNEFDASGNRLWIQAQAVMKWTGGEEDIQADTPLNVEINFTHIVEV